MNTSTKPRTRYTTWYSCLHCLTSWAVTTVLDRGVNYCPHCKSTKITTMKGEK